MTRLLLLFALLVPSFALASADCQSAAANSMIPNVTLKVIEINVRIANGWSHLLRAEIVAAPENAPVKAGEVIHILWVRTIFTDSPRLGEVLENAFIQRDTSFNPQFEPKVYYSLYDDIERVPQVNSLKEWNSIPASIQNRLISAPTYYREKIGFKDVTIQKTSLDDLDQNADAKIKPMLTALKERIREEVNLEIEDLEQGDYETDGPMKFTVELVTLTSGEPVAGEFDIRQNAESGEYWSGHGSFKWRKGKLTSVEMPDYLSYGH
jgi:hypothetical protein